jgi:hypothetical protein
VAARRRLAHRAHNGQSVAVDRTNRAFATLVLGLLVVVLVVLVKRRDERDSPYSSTARRVRTEGDFNDSPEEVDCVAEAMDELLTSAELRQWLARDPDDISVTEVQALPRAEAIADRCRQLMPLGA